MKYRAIHDADGQIFQANSVEDWVDTDSEAALYLSRGLYVTELTASEFPNAVAAVNDDSYYIDVVVTGQLVHRPSPPGIGYEWIWPDHSWQVDADFLSKKIKEKFDEIENEYESRRKLFSYESTQYRFSDGYLDVVSNYLVYLEATGSLMTSPSWFGVEDASGTYHQSFSYSSELAYINGLVIEARKGRARAWCIREYHRSAISAYGSDVLAVMNHDATAGWD